MSILGRVVGVLALSFSLCLCWSVHSDANEPHLFLGNENIPPVLFEENGEARGVVKNPFDEIAKRSSLSLDMQLMDWKQAQDKAKSGEASGLLQINRNAEREKLYLFSDPLLVSEFPIFYKSGRTDISGPNDLNGIRVGVEAAGYPRFLLSQISGANAFIVESWTEGFQKILSGDIDALIVDRWVGEYVIALNQFQGISETPTVVDTLVSHIAVRKNLPELMGRSTTRSKA